MEVIKKNKKGFLFLLTILVGFIIWFLPRPEGVSEDGWNIFAIFIATILGIILRPLPMGSIALISLTISTITNVLTFEEAFSGFCHPVVWLIVAAFLIARGFIQTGLGKRVGYFFMKLCGKSSLGLGYGLVFSEFILSPAIPSLTARVGGIIYPILRSLAKAFGSEPFDKTSRKIGGYLTQISFQGSVITSAMFLTAMAGNPLSIELASKSGIEITWAGWAWAALVPGLCSLLLMPLILFKIYPPEIKETPDAKEFARNQLDELGEMKPKEWIMCGTFILLIGLWILGPMIQMKATVAAFLGLSILLLTNVLKWKDIIEESGAWNTLFWFATLITLATFLNKFGVTTWFSNIVVGQVQGYNWLWGFLVLSLLYFYTHYFFASNLAHIGAMYAPFLIVAIALGTPPYVAALVLAFFSNLFGGLTHYGCGPAPILYGAGFVGISQWWKIGFIMSLINIFIWLVIGGAWWKLIGLW